MNAVIYPYSRLGEVDLDIRELRRDNIVQKLEDQQRSLRQIWILAEGEERSRWTSIELAVNVKLQPAELASLEEAGAHDLAVSVVTRCPTAELRQSNLLERSQVDPLRWTGKVLLDRQFVAGAGESYAIVAASFASDGDRRLVGRSLPWSLHFDAVAPFPSRGALDIRWADFAADPPAIPELTTFKDERFYIDLDDDRPTLFLNKALDYLPSLLKDQRRRGPQRGLHEVIAVEIATKTRLALIECASSHIDYEDPSDPKWPIINWQRAALEELLEDMPEDYARDELKIFGNARESAEFARQLEQIIVATVERQLKAGAVTRRAYETVVGNEVKD
ncbi:MULTISPECIES: hypothetical protein [unclassified Mycobacterium]|uniref:hypothetical protein n=1 Tax=unclassified Mycobacterium TaxID=2642494 RepID=UPI000740043C|nr:MULTISPECIES: hypothetical protein [unclassified Mycobacterium]KUH81408.1 hypothetical protein AU185_16140 [Mycobacterium sp. GA-0227b]KUH83537.1 hypothetical protein AU186_15830 [Mycobacterium sp. GA-1999]